VFFVDGINAAYRGKIKKTSVLIHNSGLLDFIRLMYRSSHDVFSARPRFEIGEAVPTSQGSDCGINFVGKQTRYRVLGLVLLALVFMQFPALATTTSVTLAWNSSTDSTIVGYNIYYGGASHTYTNKISVGQATSVTISGLVEGDTYYFAATTYSALGVESPFSSEVSYTVPILPGVQFRVTPTRQFILTVTGPIGHTYDILATQDFITWTVIGTVTMGASGSLDFTVTNAASFSRRFYCTRG
jgi:hypothetical protein